MSRKIPIQNLYFILCYVWNVVPDAMLTQHDLEKCSRIEDLYGKILSVGVSRLLKTWIVQVLYRAR